MEEPYHDFGRFDPSAKTTVRVRPTKPVLDRLMVYFTHGFVANDMLRALSDPTLTNGAVAYNAKNMFRSPNSLIERPMMQKHDELSKSSFLVHRLSEKGLAYLIEKERITRDMAELWRKVFVNKDHKPQEFWHDAAACHITASIELGCRSAGLRFVPWYEILNHHTCPQSTRDASNPLEIVYEGTHSAIPDGLFGIQQGSERPTFHFLEFDNKTERKSRKSAGALKDKHKAYGIILHRKLYMTHFGFTQVNVDYVTNGILRLTNIMNGLTETRTDANIYINPERFRFKAVRQFDREFGERAKATDHMFTEWYDGTGTELPALQ